MYRRIEGLLGNLRDFPVGERSVERIPVESSAMTRRLLRLSSSIGDLGIGTCAQDDFMDRWACSSHDLLGLHVSHLCRGLSPIVPHRSVRLVVGARAVIARRTK